METKIPGDGGVGGGGGGEETYTVATRARKQQDTP